MGRFCRSFLLASVTLMMAGCVSFLGEHHVTPESFFQHRDIQHDQYCGPFSLSLLLRFYGIDIPQTEIGQQIFNDRGQGTESVDMLLFAQSKGLELFLRKGTPELLFTQLTHGRPVIIAVQQPNRNKAHYMFVHGYTDNAFIVHDGVMPQRKIPLLAFYEMWRAAGNLMIYKP